MTHYYKDMQLAKGSELYRLVVEDKGKRSKGSCKRIRKTK